ncbi:MAG: AMP-binding protein [Candidatus Dormibacteraeota bacterium]|nr:AMP-binding protein [Candidatus Dormibacteraeota bacterium]
MSASPSWNFAGRLLERACGSAYLVDAPSGEVTAPRELGPAVASFGAGFLSAGLHAGDRLLLACDLSASTALAYLGAMYAGIVPVPVHERTWPTAAEAILSSTRARAVWTAPGFAGFAGCTAGGSVRHLTGRLSAPPSASAAACREDDLAVLMPTSGSTGIPRLVKVSHGNLIANTEAIIRSQRLRHDECAMLILPMSYCFGASVLHTHLYRGGGVVFDSRFMFPDKVLKAIDEFGCTSFAGVPTAYQLLLSRSSIRTLSLKPLRRFLQAGGALAAERVREIRAIVPHAEFFVMYGQTEATARICCLPPERLTEKWGSVGLPLDNLAVRVIDADGHEAAAGERGTIWAAGKSICHGYLDEPQASARKFREGWLVTEDIGYRDSDGFLWLIGRTDEFIKMRGIRLSLGEVEARVATTPGVSECAAAAVPHVDAGEAIALYVVAQDGGEEVLAAVRHALPKEWICESLTLVAALPRTAHGKLARWLLPKPHVRSADNRGIAGSA